MATNRLPRSRDWLGLARLIGTLDHSLAHGSYAVQDLVSCCSIHPLDQRVQDHLIRLADDRDWLPCYLRLRSPGLLRSRTDRGFR
jgi:hypothetical protein